MDNEKITLYRIENGDHETHNITIKNLIDNNSSSHEVENILINERDYDKITEQILNSSVFSIKPHSVQYFAFDETNIILFESNIHGGYVFVDLHISFTITEDQFQGLYKAIDYLNSFSKK